MIYTLDQLFKVCRENGTLINNVYVPARPRSGPWTWRLQAAWAVLTGRADAITWPKGQ